MHADAVLLCLLVKMGKSNLYFAFCSLLHFSCVCFLLLSLLFHEGEYTNPHFLWFFHYQNWLMKSESAEGRKANPSGMCKGPGGKEGNWDGKYSLINRNKQGFPNFGDYAVTVTAANICWTVSCTIPLKKISNIQHLRCVSIAKVMASTINSDMLKPGL